MGKSALTIQFIQVPGEGPAGAAAAGGDSRYLWPAAAATPPRSAVRAGGRLCPPALRPRRRAPAARRRGSRASQECVGRAELAGWEAPNHLIAPAGARALWDRQLLRAELPVPRARAWAAAARAGFAAVRPPPAPSERSPWQLGGGCAWSPGFSAHAEPELPRPAVCFSLCVFALLSSLLGNMSG